jgi:hypothetical protein
MIVFLDVGLGPPKPFRLRSKVADTVSTEQLWQCRRSESISIAERGQPMQIETLGHVLQKVK